MRTLIVGAGPIGTYLAAQLTEAGAYVVLHGRGDYFKGIARQGVSLAEYGSDITRLIPVQCSINPPTQRNWDMVVLAVKAQQLPDAAQQFAGHVRDAIVLLPQNGLPWWQFLGTDDAALRLQSVDPGGRAEAVLPLETIAGCVVTKGLSLRPDHTLLEAKVSSDLVTVGDVLTGSGASDVAVSLLSQTNLPVKQVADIRVEKWRKLLINVAFNPLGAISHLGFGETLDEVEGERLAQNLMNEAIAVARVSGLLADINVETAFARARASRLHKTSMLQDVEAGRRLEVEPILGVMLELAGHHRVDTPTIEAVYGCLRLIDRSLMKGPIQRAIK